MNDFRPELGHAVFGSLWGEYDCPGWAADELFALIDGMHLPDHVNGAYGVEHTGPAFIMRPYYWGECDCGYDKKEELWNDTHDHDPSCYQKVRDAWEKTRKRGLTNSEYHGLCTQFGIPWDKGRGCGTHCTCDYRQQLDEFLTNNFHNEKCSLVLPNFEADWGDIRLAIRWYKYIGRGMSCNIDLGSVVDGHLRFRDLISRCIEEVLRHA